jgi:hypothetical protein
MSSPMTNTDGSLGHGVRQRLEHSPAASGLGHGVSPPRGDSSRSRAGLDELDAEAVGVDHIDAAPPLLGSDGRGHGGRPTDARPASSAPRRARARSSYQRRRGVSGAVFAVVMSTRVLAHAYVFKAARADAVRQRQERRGATSDADSARRCRGLGVPAERELEARRSLGRRRSSGRVRRREAGVRARETGGPSGPHAAR